MFTGLIERVGVVREVTSESISVRPNLPWPDPIQAGESIAVNGACLTVIEPLAAEQISFDVSPETFHRTSLGSLQAGSMVNLERAAKVGDRLGGHIVQGHVDGTGELVHKRDQDQFSVFTFQAPPGYDRYLIDKGSVAIDGISLTVVTPLEGRFDVWLIPATLNNTNLRSLEFGASVNLEFDLIAKYVEKLLVR